MPGLASHLGRTAVTDGRRVPQADGSDAVRHDSVYPFFAALLPPGATFSPQATLLSPPRWHPWGYAGRTGMIALSQRREQPALIP